MKVSVSELKQNAGMSWNKHMLIQASSASKEATQQLTHHQVPGIGIGNLIITSFLYNKQSMTIHSSHVDHGRKDSITLLHLTER